MEVEGFTDLVRRAGSGDDAALREIHRRAESTLHGLAFGRLGQLGPSPRIPRLRAKIRRLCAGGDLLGHGTGDDVGTFARFRSWMAKELLELGGPWGPEGVVHLSLPDIRDSIESALDSLSDPVGAESLRLRSRAKMSLREIAREPGLDHVEAARRYGAALAELERVQLGRRLEKRTPADQQNHRPADSPPDDPLGEQVETMTELYWRELHRGDDPEVPCDLGELGSVAAALRVRFALIRLMYEERPPSRDGSLLPASPWLDSDDCIRCLVRARDGDRRAIDRAMAVLVPTYRESTPPCEGPYSVQGIDEGWLREQCLRAWERLGSLQREDVDSKILHEIRIWLGRLVHRLQKERWRESLAGPGESPSIRAARIQGCLARFPDRQEAEILRLHFQGGMGVPEIASQMGLEWPSVRAKLRHGARRLELALADLLRDWRGASRNPIAPDLAPDLDHPEPGRLESGASHRCVHP